MLQKRKWLLVFLICLLPAVSIFSYASFQAYREAREKKLVLEKRKVGWLALKKKITDEVARFKGEAGIVIKDLETDWEFSLNEDKFFPSASIAKVPIMAACFLASEEGRLRLGQRVALKPADKLGGSGVLKTVVDGTVFTIEELIGRMIYDSDNTATNILTNILGINYLNNAFKAFGLKNTSLSRRIADYRSRDRGVENYTTAADTALLLEKMYRRALINKNISERCLGILKLQRVSDRIPNYLPADIVVAHKTGLERGVCHDAGITYTCKGNFLIVVLTKHAYTNSVPAKEFIARIALYTYKYFEQL